MAKPMKAMFCESYNEDQSSLLYADAEKLNKAVETFLLQVTLAVATPGKGNRSVDQK